MSNDHGALWASLASARPLVQCVTNVVSADLMANVLLACRCSPAMVADESEAEEFARKAADAVLVNVGTLSASSLAGARAALRGAREASKPWVLDPVAVGGTKHRTEAVVSLVNEFSPTVIKGNGSEVIALAKALGLSLQENGGDKSASAETAGRGVDAAPGLTDEEKLSAARKLAEACRCVVVATGEVDFVVAPASSSSSSSAAAAAADDDDDDGGGGRGAGEALEIAVRSGSELLPAVTATGCSLGALVAAMVSAAAKKEEQDKEGEEKSPLALSRVARAAAAACAAFGAAAKIAEAKAIGPGSFRVAFVDALWNLKGDDVDALGGVEVSKGR